MIRVLASLCLLAGGLQASSSDWSNLKLLHPGENLTLDQTDGRRVNCAFVAVAEDSLTVRTDSSETAVSRSNVARVTARSRTKRLRNALIGFGVGLGVSLVTDKTLGAYLYNESTYESGARAAVWALPPALFGGIGAAIPSHPVVYKAPKR